MHCLPIKVGLVLYQLIYNMNPNIDMTYTRSLIDVFFWNAVYDIYLKKKAQGIMRKECWLPSISGLILLVRSESTLPNVFFQSTICGTFLKMECLREWAFCFFDMPCIFPVFLMIPGRYHGKCF
jgi:hypothetical protein